MIEYQCDDNYLSLGTPGEQRRTQEARLEAWWAKFYAIGVALLLALTALWWVNSPRANQPRPADVRIDYRMKSLRLGETRHFLSEQGCLIFLHKELVSPIAVSVVSEHC